MHICFKITLFSGKHKMIKYDTDSYKSIKLSENENTILVILRLNKYEKHILNINLNIIF